MNRLFCSHKMTCSFCEHSSNDSEKLSSAMLNEVMFNLDLDECKQNIYCSLPRSATRCHGQLSSQPQCYCQIQWHQLQTLHIFRDQKKCSTGTSLFADGRNTVIDRSETRIIIWIYIEPLEEFSNPVVRWSKQNGRRKTAREIKQSVDSKVALNQWSESFMWRRW